MIKLTIDQLAFLYQQIEDFSNKILSLKLCGFGKGHSTQHALLKVYINGSQQSIQLSPP